MRAHEVGEGELLEPQLLVRSVEALHELLVDARGRLAHHAQDIVAHMLGRQTQLPAHVVGGKLADEFVCVLVEQHVVEAYTAAHEDLLHTGQRAQLAQQLQVVAVVDLQALAGLGAQAALADAGPLFQLLGAGGFAEVRRGAANVMDVALETGQLGDELGFGQDAFVAAALDDAPLVEGQAAKRALAYAAAVARDRELHLLDGGDASDRLVGGVVAALVG